MPDLRRQISDPRDLGETASSARRRWQGRSVDANPPPAARGTRGRSFLILVRVPRTRCAFGPGRLPLGTDKIFEELDSVALRGQDSSDVGQRISRDQACVDQCSFLDTAGYRLCHWRPPRSRCGRRPEVGKGPGHNVICTLPPAGPSFASTSSSKRPALADSCEAEGLTGSPLDRRLIFSNFLVGGSNQLAHSEAQRIAGAGPADPLLYNPLYLHASVGLGKTHLLQAVAHAATGAKRRVQDLQKLL